MKLTPIVPAWVSGFAAMGILRDFLPLPPFQPWWFYALTGLGSLLCLVFAYLDLWRLTR